MGAGQRGYAFWVVLVAALALGCSHSTEIEELRSKTRGVGGQGVTGGASGTTVAGTSGGGTPSMPPCEPCPELPELPPALAMGAPLESCCTGFRDRACGLRFEGGDRCFPRDDPGVNDDACPGVSAGGGLAGCCRPDGRCGLALNAEGLGCVARQDVPEMLGFQLEPSSCSIPCDNDVVCKDIDLNLVCAEPELGNRICVRECQTDGECGAGQVCGLRSNPSAERVDVYCQSPVGPRQLNMFCNMAGQCSHGVCARTSTGEQFCSRPCADGDDCFEGRPACVPSPIPVSASKSQEIPICTALN